jgi:glucose-6-phosphate isomerase
MTRLALAPSHSERKHSAWRALQLHYKQLRRLHLRDLFGKDPGRGYRMTVEGAGLYFDYSKNRVTDHTLKLLVDLAEDSGLHARIDAMFRGETVNTTERVPALHVALRAPRGASIFVNGNNVVPQVHATLDKMASVCNRIRDGEWLGYTGKRIRHVVNIGVGGFHLGPEMATAALKHYAAPTLSCHFVGNVDPADFVEAVRDLDPSETLFVICSRTFANPEIISNAQAAREWLLAAMGADEKAVPRHFLAVSNKALEVTQFGVDAANVFGLWDWVGSRYSVGSAVGLSTMLSIGPKNFLAMLDGQHQMDVHFLAAPFEQNLPVLMGLLSVWYNNFFGAHTVAVFPYEHYLQRFPAYLQHLIMESNGKHVTLIGTEVTQHTSPICWGEIGTNAQYSLLQLLHQGTRLIPCDFIAFARPLVDSGRDHDTVIANLLAQAEALAFGRSTEDITAEGIPDWLVPHLVFEGNHPSNIILAEQLNPESLGKLIALYEHSVYTQSVIWNINSFDQWGLEVGDHFSARILTEIDTRDDLELCHDSSTNNLIRRYRQFRNAA